LDYKKKTRPGASRTRGIIKLSATRIIYSGLIDGWAGNRAFRHFFKCVRRIT